MIRYDRKCRHEYNDKSIQNLFIFMKRRKILFKKKKLFDIEEEKYGKRYKKSSDIYVIKDINDQIFFRSHLDVIVR